MVHPDLQRANDRLNRAISMWTMFEMADIPKDVSVFLTKVLARVALRDLERYFGDSAARAAAAKAKGLLDE